MRKRPIIDEAANARKQKFIDLRHELFQLNQPELDFGLYRIMHAKSTVSSLGRAPYTREAFDTRPSYTRPRTTENGHPWPTKLSYLKGFERLNVDGLSTVTVDNSQKDSDVYVKLVPIGSAGAHPVRRVFIPAHGKFTIAGIRVGTDDIRYRDLDSGALAKSENFDLTEVPTLGGTQYSDVRMTLCMPGT